MTILKAIVIILGLSICLEAFTQFSAGTGGSTASQAGGTIGNIMLLVIGISLVVLPAISIYRSFNAGHEEMDN